jgi:hypothetical protein
MFSLNSLSATPTQQLNPSGRLSRRTTRAVKTIAAAAVALLAAGNTFASAAENPTRTAKEHHACAVIMGLHQSGDLYDTPASEASKRPFLSWIKPDWFRRIEPDALERGSSSVRRLSLSAL